MGVFKPIANFLQFFIHFATKVFVRIKNSDIICKQNEVK